jgi:asparagine synthase (glutamine-hydrolysing)
MKGQDLLRLETQASSAALVASSQASQGRGIVAKTKNGTFIFNGTIYWPIRNDGDGKNVFKQMLEHQDPAKVISNFVRDVEGDFSLLTIQDDDLLAARDPIGVETLYYGKNNSLEALASNRKALWKIDIEDTKSFPPGNVGTFSRSGVYLKPVKFLTPSKPEFVSMDNSTEILASLLKRSVQIRVCGEKKKVAVAFSGGVDSSIVAFLAKQCVSNLELIHVSLANQPETKEAKEAARILDLPLKVFLYTQNDVEKAVLKVVNLIEDPDPVKASVGIPFFWNAHQAAKLGIEILLAGQGADELFGGYQRYAIEYLRDGEEKVRETMFKDVTGIHESNIERDKKICNFFDIQLRLPFASFQIAEVSAKIPVEMKLEKKTGSLRKLVLRKAAQKMGLPNELSARPKKAVQYSTGVNSALKRIAKKQNLTLKDYIKSLYDQSRK